METTQIGDIGNYYGGLHVFKKDSKYYWFIKDWNDNYIEEISEELYELLIKENK